MGKFYTIEYTETEIACIEVEADNAEEAYERFNNLLNTSDIVFDSLNYYSSNTVCVGCSKEPGTTCDYVLTNDEYKKL